MDLYSVSSESIFTKRLCILREHFHQGIDLQHIFCEGIFTKRWDGSLLGIFRKYFYQDVLCKSKPNNFSISFFHCSCYWLLQLTMNARQRLWSQHARTNKRYTENTTAIHPPTLRVYHAKAIDLSISVLVAHVIERVDSTSGSVYLPYLQTCSNSAKAS